MSVFIFLKNFMGLDLRPLFLFATAKRTASTHQICLNLFIISYLFIVNLLFFSEYLDEKFSTAIWFVFLLLFAPFISTREIMDATERYAGYLLAASIILLFWEVSRGATVFNKTNTRWVGIAGSVNYSAYFMAFLSAILWNAKRRLLAFIALIISTSFLSFGALLGVVLLLIHKLTKRFRLLRKTYLLALASLIFFSPLVNIYFQGIGPRYLLANNFLQIFLADGNWLLGSGIGGSEVFFASNLKGEVKGDVHSVVLELLSMFGVLLGGVFVVKLFYEWLRATSWKGGAIVTILPIILFESSISFPLVFWLIFGKKSHG